MSKRVPLGLQLVLGKDNDLIDWWESLDKSNRSAALKAALRTALGLQTNQQTTHEVDELATLRHQVAVMSEQMSHYQQWFEYIDRNIQAARMGEPLALPDESPVVDGEAEAKMNQRANKWKKQGW